MLKNKSIENLGMLFAVMAYFSFSLLDAVQKTAIIYHSVFQLLFIKYCFVLFLSLIESQRKKNYSFYKSGNVKIQLLRSVLSIIESACFILSFRYLTLADAHSIASLTPVLVVALSAIILREHVSLKTWIAIFIGFIGVLIIMNPTNEVFSLFSILPLLAALFWAISNIVLKFIPENISSVKINFYSINFSYLGSILILFSTSEFSGVENSLDWLLLILVGILGGFASILFSYAYRVISPSTLAPFEYLGIPSSFILGWIFFYEAPIEQLFPGVIGIVIAGFIIIWRENKLSIKSKDPKKLL